MKYDEIIKLLDAGYTRDEILNMQDAPEEEQDTAQDEEQEESISMDAIMSEVKDMFAEMKKELTAMNILNSRQSGEDNKTGEDILAAIINPTRNKNGGN